ncbi:uncharacterized protein LOC107015230 isoform X2 [Solanum pennellii]|uniref:Uncharacterized protein LOC107015230 isoform X2 n=1 Tax=Solanum pennellii TaxID=28526 RepID=A0ABM1V735_SOLPN|nr:uncharacterized protein LOC107015230 isoform X2 [Solanum pennellii]
MANSASTSTGSDSVPPSGIDAGSHFYIHPSDNPGAVLVPIPFNGTGFHSWRRSVLRSLSVKNKLVFINGECKRPEVNHSSYRQWVRCDDMVTSQILNSLDRDIAGSVEYVNDALELWTELEDRYDQANGAKLYQTQKEINDLNQGILDITTYYTRMKRLWEELNSLCVSSQCSCVCVCGAKANVQKAEQDRRLIQFLMGLNVVYTTIRGSILMMNPLPSLAQAFALLVQEEKQREFKPNNQMFTENSSLAAVSSSSGGRSFQTNYSTSNTTPRGRPFCDFCRRPGHVRAKCYKLHGYPSNDTNGSVRDQHNPRHNNKGRGASANSVRLSCDGNASGQTKESSSTSCNDHPQGDENISITKEQYDQVSHLLNQFQNDGVCGSVNYAGPLHGIPYGLKDIIAVPNYTTTWGSTSFKDQVLDIEAWVYKRLKSAGAVLVAKLVTGSLAYDDIWFGGRTRNPWNIEEYSTGSSAGPASCTSAGLVPFAIGSETCGSITYPASRCGVTALRPTFGAVGRTGIMSIAESLDKIGPFCRNSVDCVIILDAIRGKDPDDVSSRDISFRDPFSVDITKLTVGYLEDAEMEVVHVLQSKGVNMVPFNLSYTVDSVQGVLNFTMDVEMLAHFDKWQRSNLDDEYEAQDQWPTELRRARAISAVDYFQTSQNLTGLVTERSL